MRTITDLSFAPFDVELREPFGIATGAQLVARNVIVRLRLDDGSEGLGEAAPFPAVNGETQAQALAALPAAAAALRGQSASRYRHTAALAREVLQHTKSALAAVETALLDALCRSAGISLWSFFGGAEPILYTDITIPTGDAEAARSAALKAWEGGFRTLKVKVGGAALESDAARVRAAHAAAPEAALVLDANASLSPAQALALLGALGPARSKLVLFEQPTPAEDLAALRAVQQEGGVAVAADESARSVADVLSIVAAQAARVVTVKITTTGLLEAWAMITVARAHG
ncbi:MAG TPA: enolase C-terminal domain-like protein, partial [Polyangiaceae bacterium]|nr:enolase C-terminal domain-like protein [Polyangiaceae bacterium]